MCTTVIKYEHILICFAKYHLPTVNTKYHMEDQLIAGLIAIIISIGTKFKIVDTWACGKVFFFI